MSLNLGTATTSLNKFFGEFSPQRWKQDLFYRNINSQADADSPVSYSSQTSSGRLATIQDVYSLTKDYLSGQYKGFSSTRGLLSIDGDSFDKNKTLFFQFNPESVKDDKGVVYTDSDKTGFDNSDYIWVKGGPRTISFELTLDSTLSSFTEDIITSNSYTHDPKKGTLNQVEFLQSLLRPYHNIPAGTKSVPLFSKNGIVPNINRFTNPPQVIFTYGPIYLVGVVTEVGINHELFNRNLAPIRTKASISFRVREDIRIEEATNYTNEKSIGAEAYEPQTLK